MAPFVIMPGAAGGTGYHSHTVQNWAAHVQGEPLSEPIRKKERAFQTLVKTCAKNASHLTGPGLLGQLPRGPRGPAAAPSPRPGPYGTCQPPVQGWEASPGPRLRRPAATPRTALAQRSRGWRPPCSERDRSALPPPLSRPRPSSNPLTQDSQKPSPKGYFQLFLVGVCPGSVA